MVANKPVPAGMFVTTLNDRVKQTTIDRFLNLDPGETVLSRVKGDSMIKAGIHLRHNAPTVLQDFGQSHPLGAHL